MSTIFYSWQSDLPNATNRGFIQQALENAVESIRTNKTLQVEPVVDRDTAGVPGSPDIAATIFAKIDSCDAFVCDVSIINAGFANRPTPNPNALVELGYAIKHLGWSRIVMVCNVVFGPVEELPFDLRMKRIVTYRSRPGDADRATERRSLTLKLAGAIEEIYRHIATQVSAAEESKPQSYSEFRWYEKMKDQALARHAQSGFRGFVEAFAVPTPRKVNFSQQALLEKADRAKIETFGWPIGVMGTSEGMRPRPTGEGIVNIVERKDRFDFWAIHQDGSFYLLESFLEDTNANQPSELIFDMRIVRITEMLMYLGRLYGQLGFPAGAAFHFWLRHNGLVGRHLVGSKKRKLSLPYGPALENEVESPTLGVSLHDLNESLPNFVQKLVDPLFVLFDFFELNSKICEEIVRDFEQGRT